MFQIITSINFMKLHFSDGQGNDSSSHLITLNIKAKRRMYNTAQYLAAVGILVSGRCEAIVVQRYKNCQ